MADPVNETLAQILDRSGDFRILRRVPAPALSDMTDDDRARAGLATGVVLDTETTGLGPDDEVIELGMARFAFDPVLPRIVDVIDTFSALSQPRNAISRDITRLTGITDADVAGHVIDDEAVSAFVRGAAVAVAHNAAFDRQVVERRWPLFARMPWACSLTQISWRDEGFEGRRLGDLLTERRLFSKAHRALDDALALLHLLRQPVLLGATAFSIMMREAARPSVKIWAVHAPFEVKDHLKARGYRWAAGGGGTPRAWHREVPEPAAEAEIAWLREHVYRDPAAVPATRRISALDRFSVRADVPDPRSEP